MADQNVIVGFKADDKGLLAYTNQLQKELSDLKGQQAALNGQVRNYDKIATQANRVTRNSNGNYKEANRTSRMARGGIGQLGYQIQDVAVQIQGGQNLGLILGQQGSQIASVFGTGGIVAGAIISIGALMATMMIPKLFESGREAKNLEKIFKDLNDTLMTVTNEGVYTLADGFKELAESNREYAEIELRSKLISAIEAVSLAQSGLSRELEEFVFQQYKTGNAVRGNSVIMNRFATEMGITADQALALNAASRKAMSGVEGSGDALVSMMAALASTDGVTDKFLEVASAAGSFAMESERAADFVAAIRDALGDLDGALDSNTTEQNDQREAIKETLETMRLEVAAYGISTRMIALRDAAIQGATTSQLKEVDALQEKLEVMKGEEEAQELLQGIYEKSGDAQDQYITKYREQLDRLNAARDDDYISDQEYTKNIALLAQQRAQNFDKFAQQEMQAKMQQLTFMGQAADRVGDAMGEESKAAKAAFLISQSIAIAQAIINTELAASKALALGPFTGPTMAMAIRAMGYMGVAAIAGQTLGSFEGGGFTGMGARTGGVDGKGGFPAILHPNESVIDHSKGQGAGMTVNVNITANDTKGFDELLYKRRGQLVNIINQAINNKGRTSLA